MCDFASIHDFRLLDYNCCVDYNYAFVNFSNQLYVKIYAHNGFCSMYY